MHQDRAIERQVITLQRALANTKRRTFPDTLLHLHHSSVLVKLHTISEELQCGEDLHTQPVTKLLPFICLCLRDDIHNSTSSLSTGKEDKQNNRTDIEACAAHVPQSRYLACSGRTGKAGRGSLYQMQLDGIHNHGQEQINAVM